MLILVLLAEYAEFLHLPDQKFTDFEKVRDEIERFTEETCPNQVPSAQCPVPGAHPVPSVVCEWCVRQVVCCPVVCGVSGVVSEWFVV